MERRYAKGRAEVSYQIIVAVDQRVFGRCANRFHIEEADHGRVSGECETARVAILVALLVVSRADRHVSRIYASDESAMMNELE